VVPKIPTFLPMLVRILNSAFASQEPSKAAAAPKSPTKKGKPESAASEAVGNVKKEDRKVVQQAVMVSVEVIVESIGKFITPYLPQVVAALLPIPKNCSNSVVSY